MHPMTVTTTLFSPPTDNGVLSSIVCTTAAAAGVGDVPVKVVMDKLEVPFTKKFLYKENPIISSVEPRCSFQR